MTTLTLAEPADRRIEIDSDLPMPGWKHSTEFNSTVFLMRYISGALMTMGQYPSAQSAMLASDEAVWIPNGDRRWRSQDSRTIIEPGPEY